jgi:hypothetical protein
MRSVELEYSKSKIDQAGEVLKTKNGSQEDMIRALDVLSNWRAYHAVPLDTFAKVLKERVQKVSDQAIVAQRLKRTPSILLKLSNHSTMRLSTMQVPNFTSLTTPISPKFDHRFGRRTEGMVLDFIGGQTLSM